MNDTKIITVSGFSFENPTTGEEALKEQQAVEYVDKQLNFDDTTQLLALYNQMIARRMFHTEVGYAYLKRIQDYLMQSDVDPASIESIPVVAEDVSTSDVGAKRDEGKSKNPIENDNDNTNYYKETVRLKNKERKLIGTTKRLQKVAITFIVISIVLVATVVAMFIIANTSDNPTILNYEEVITDKYAAWEQDLERREADVTKKENELKISK